MFQDAGQLFFSRDAALRNAAYLSSAPRSHRLRGGANPSGYTLTVDGLQVFQYSLFSGVSHFSHFFRSNAQPLTLPSRWYAAMCTYYAGAVFPHPLSFSGLWQWVETRFSVLSMQFRARHSRANNSLCYIIFCSHA